MIVYTFSEEQILRELIEDYINLKKDIKNKVNKIIVARQKKGMSISTDDNFSVNFTSNNNNHWYSLVSFLPDDRALWRCDMCCIVESDKGTKDYYLLRGLKTTPYFIKITSHTIKRFLERGGVFESLKDQYGSEFFANLVICPHETIVGLKFNNPKYYEIISKLGLEDISDEETSYMFELMRGVFFGHKSDKGNFTFKTYISPFMSLSKALENDTINLDDKESLLSYMLIYVHQYFNRHLWDKENLENYLYREFGNDPDIDFEKSKILVLKP